MPTILALLGMFISVLLIGIILLQRGRGGGLVGALSGLGGQSAFGTKAGDMFTRITIGIAFVWVLLAGGHGILLRGSTEKFKNETKEASVSQDKGSGSSKSDDSKAESGIGSSSSESKSDGKKESDSKSSTKSDEPIKEITPDEDKKPDSAPKSKEPPKKELDESSDSKSDDKSGDKK